MTLQELMLELLSSMNGIFMVDENSNITSSVKPN